ncbi:MAG: AAA family ATPase [Bermanella sp.]
MIIKALFKNFYSFYEESELSFEVGKKPSPSFYDINLENGLKLNKVIAVLGANGSGKTQFIKPMAFLRWFIVDSFLKGDPGSGIPIQGHRFHSDEPTEFEIQFIIAGVEYKYRLVLTDHHVKHESLYQKTSKQFSYLFVREKTDSGYDYKQKGFGFHAAQAKQIRENASLLGAAFNYDVEGSEKFIRYFSQVSANVQVLGRSDVDFSTVIESAEFFHKNPDYKGDMNHHMCHFDLGLSEIIVKESIGQLDTGEKQTLYVPFGVHKNGDKWFEMPFFEESSGTRSAFVLLRRVLPILKHGGSLFIDEIDNDLHPHMLPHLLELFKHPETNPHEAQIVFTCHTPEIINFLKKHQVYLVEKQHQYSEAWRLDGVQGVRADDNLYAKYMAGALSAVPELA